MSYVVFGRSGLRVIGAGQERLLAGEPIVAFALSPDGESIAISHEVVGGSAISLIEVRTGRRALLAERESTSFGRPAWHPSGKILTVVATAADGVSHLFHITPKGDVERLDILLGRHAIAEPDWSPSGRWLAFEAQPIDELRGMTVYLYDTSDDSTVLVDPIEEPVPKAVCPRFSRAGRLVYTYSPGGVLESTIAFYHPRNGDRRSLTGLGLNEPRWAFDHEKVLAAQHGAICGTRLVVLDADGGESLDLETEAGHQMPVFLSRRTAAYIQRSCPDPEQIPVAAGVLAEVSLDTGRLDIVARDVMLAEPMRQTA